MNILEKFSLDGKTALVTGGSRGIGLSIATGLAEAGADVINVSRSRADELESAVIAAGRRFLHIQADLALLDDDRAAELITQAGALNGQIDILVNNAGVNLRASASSFTYENYQAVLDINLKATFLLSQAVARQMQQIGGGKIINIASMLSYQGGRDSSAYAASKHGVVGLTKAFAVEWAGQNINVNGIAPGYFTTELTSPLHGNASANEMIRSRIPAGAWGDPDDLKGVAILLASPAGSYMHGSTVVVDGGWLAR